MTPPTWRGRDINSPSGGRPMRRYYAMSYAMSLTSARNGYEPVSHREAAPLEADSLQS